MTRYFRLLTVCLLALAGCTGEYKLIVEDQGTQTDGGAGQSGGDGDGDGDTGDGDGDTGDGDGDPGDGDGDGDGDDNVIRPSDCSRGGLCQLLDVNSTDKLDLLFMIDNSQSMEQEQASLSQEFPRLVNMLSSGDFDDDGRQDFPPAKDIQFGVVSSDLGLPGLESAGIDRCLGLGDEGRLLNTANAELAAAGLCSATTYNPPFLRFATQNGDDPAQLANDLACIGTLGIEGCGFEQQLESMLKAVWPGDDQSVVFLADPAGFGMYGNAGPSFPNGEFIRNDESDPSLIALVMVTDEEDCSSRRMDHFVPAASPNGLNTRCYYEGLRGQESNLFQVERYIELLKQLRPGREDLVMFNAIVGVPPRIVDAQNRSEVDFTDLTSSNAFYDSILNAPEMQERVDDKGTPEVLDDDGLIPSCDRGDFAKAYPPRRIVQVAKGFGANGLVQSICQDDFSGPIQAIVNQISEQLGEACLPIELERTNGRVACDVYWHLPPTPVGNSPSSCDQLDFLTAAGMEGNWKRCKVNQLPVIQGASGSAPGTTPTSADGFYYDDFSDDAAAGCRASSSGARIAFTPTAIPPSGVEVVLDCD